MIFNIFSQIDVFCVFCVGTTLHYDAMAVERIYCDGIKLLNVFMNGNKYAVLNIIKDLW